MRIRWREGLPREMRRGEKGAHPYASTHFSRRGVISTFFLPGLRHRMMTSAAVLAAMIASAAGPVISPVPITTVVATSATYPSTCTPRSLQHTSAESQTPPKSCHLSASTRATGPDMTRAVDGSIKLRESARKHCWFFQCAARALSVRCSKTYKRPASLCDPPSSRQLRSATAAIVLSECTSLFRAALWGR